MRKSSKSQTLPLLRDVDIVPLPKRGLHQETLKKYGYGMVEWQGQRVQCATFHDDAGRPVAQKLRFPDKTFKVLGDMRKARLYGQHLCRGTGKMIVVTTGEHDAHSVCQSMGLQWPAVSVKNGDAGAYDDIKENLEFLEGYDKVVLMFDQDQSGQAALDKCLALFTPGKVSVAYLDGFKDANAALQADKPDVIRDSAWGAKPWRPDGLVNLKDLKDRIRRPLQQGIAYPWPDLNKMLFGWRPGDLITWCAGTGVGKSTLVSEILYDLIGKDEMVGIIYLEEGVDRAGKRVIGLHVSKPLHLPGYEISDAEFDEAWAATLGKGNVIAYDHFGSLAEENLINRIRYMVKSDGVRTFILDHVSMVVSGMDLSADERRALDHLMTTLKALCQETGAAGHVVSHLRRGDGEKGHEDGKQVHLSQLRGSQAIAQLSDAVIAAERNQQAGDEAARDAVQLRVLKNRYAGITGPADLLRYNHATGRLKVVEDGDLLAPWEGDDRDY